jgi:hypothetical protein
MLAVVTAAYICLEDEAGQSLRPPKVRTCARRGQTPTIAVSGKGSGRVSVAGLITAAHQQLHSAVILVWDYLNTHVSAVMRAFTDARRDWLTVVRLPAYAPDLNPPSTGPPSSRDSSPRLGSPSSPNRHELRPWPLC